MIYILCDENGNELKRGDDYDFALLVNDVYDNPGFFLLDENGNGIEC